MEVQSRDIWLRDSRFADKCKYFSLKCSAYEKSGVSIFSLLALIPTLKWVHEFWVTPSHAGPFCQLPIGQILNKQRRWVK